MGVEAANLPVFVYGLLRPGCRGFQELNLGGRVDLIGPDRIAGRLHDLGDYPGVVLDGDGVVQGELLLPRNVDLLAALDRYEDYDPADTEGSEYLRVKVTTLGGREAWIYACQRDMAQCPIIANGDWLATMRDRHA